MTRGANQSRYVSTLVHNDAPLATNQNDKLALQGLIRDDQRHVQMILATGKLYGPMTPEAQIKAVEYAYNIKMLR